MQVCIRAVAINHSFLSIRVTLIRFRLSGPMSKRSAAALIAAVSFGASTVPKCSARLRMISTRQRGIGIAICRAWSS